MESTESMESMETMESMNMGKWEIQPRSTSEEYFSLESNEREPIDVASLSGGKKSLDRNARFSPLECGVNKTLNYGEYVVIESPGFGQTLYPNNFQCLWNLSFQPTRNLCSLVSLSELFGETSCSLEEDVSLDLASQDFP